VLIPVLDAWFGRRAVLRVQPQRLRGELSRLPQGVRPSPASRSTKAGRYPAQYNGALFFADHSRNEIWAILPGANGLPDPSRLQSFVGVDATGGAAGIPST
jgi:hypothetical protein